MTAAVKFAVGAPVPTGTVALVDACCPLSSTTVNVTLVPSGHSERVRDVDPGDGRRAVSEVPDVTLVDHVSEPSRRLAAGELDRLRSGGRCRRERELGDGSTPATVVTV